MAVPDVAGRNFWGGRTYVRDQGPPSWTTTARQRHLRWLLRDPDGFVEELSWVAGGTAAAAGAAHGRGAPVSRRHGVLGARLHLRPHQCDGGAAEHRQPGHQRPPRRRLRRLLLARAGRTEPAAVFTAERRGRGRGARQPADWLALAGRRVDAGLRRRDRRHPRRPLVRPHRRIPGRRLRPRLGPAADRRPRPTPSPGASSPRSPTAAWTGRRRPGSGPSCPTRERPDELSGEHDGEPAVWQADQRRRDVPQPRAERRLVRPGRRPCRRRLLPHRLQLRPRARAAGAALRATWSTGG